MDVDVVAATYRAHSAVGELDELRLPVLSDDQVVALVESVTALRARVDAVAARLATDADRRRVAERTGHRSTTSWWAHRCRLTRGEAGRLLGLGQRLEDDLHEPVRAALAAGRLVTDQAAVIVAAVDNLPADLPDPSLYPRVRDHLLAEAAHHDARALRILGKRALDVIGW